MISIQERDSCAEVLASIHNTPQFQKAGTIYREFFAEPDNWASQVLSDRWLLEDMGIIQSVLASWYRA